MQGVWHVYDIWYDNHVKKRETVALTDILFCVLYIQQEPNFFSKELGQNCCIFPPKIDTLVEGFLQKFDVRD